MRKIKLILMVCLSLLMIIAIIWTIVALNLPIDNEHYTIAIINKTKFEFTEAYIEFNLGEKHTQKIPYVISNNNVIYINAETKCSSEEMNSLVFSIKDGEEKQIKADYFDGPVGGMCRIYIEEANGEFVLTAKSGLTMGNAYLYAKDIIMNKIFNIPQLDYMKFPD